jgi:hypothetical protein
MKGTLKVIGSLILIIIFLVACFGFATIGYFAAWLHTYQVFTEKRPVAEITISEARFDNFGQYADVTFTPIDTESALTKAFSPNSTTETKGTTSAYKLYGEVVYVGGPIVKFHDSLILLNFKTIYKVGRVFARYESDNDLEKERSPEMFSSFDINNGFYDWKDIHDNLTSNNVQGAIYRSLIETTQVSMPGMYISNKEIKYTLYITNNGFLWVADF